LHLGERQRRVYFADGTNVPQKKIFYALRPAATLRWLRLHPDAAIAPMHFPTLMSECEPSAELALLVSELIERKSITRELGSEPLPATISAFINEEFERARATFAPRSEPASAIARVQAEELYRRLVHKAFATAYN
jgi:hypothetical protein